jgi:hypothetical protein
LWAEANELRLKHGIIGVKTKLTSSSCIRLSSRQHGKGTPQNLRTIEKWFDFGSYCAIRR